MSPEARDKYLTAHRFGNTEFYRIKLDSTPSSIRDQLRKAIEFIEIAYEDKRIQAGDKILVVGAGVAGVAAARRAVDLGVQTLINDRYDEPFSAQVECNKRWLHPHEYDWPKPNFENDFFPDPLLDKDFTGISDLLHWKANTPSKVALDWRVKFRNWIDRARQIIPPEGPIRWERRWFPALTEQTDFRGYIRRLVPENEFHLVLMCVGGRECCWVGKSKFRSFSFWQPDPYGTANYGVTLRPRVVLRTLISGGGDGALQDFLRISARKQRFRLPLSALQILQKLLPFLNACGAYSRMLDQVNALGGDLHRPEPEALRTILTEFILKAAAEDGGAMLERELDKLIDPALFDERKRTIDLNFAENLFKPVYLLNAFLVRLFEWRIRERSGRSVFQPGARVKAIRRATDAHTCTRDPKKCFLKPHTVTFEPLASDAVSIGQRTYDVIVIRHGIIS